MRTRCDRGLVLAPAPPRPTGRRLRVGILSADLRLHPVGHFLETVLDALRQREVDLVAYANQARGAFVPERIRGAFGQWRDIADETDQRVADTIAADDLDVLLDLSGHTTGNRIGVLMRRPARRQVSWLGYFGTTGLPFIDAVIADPLCVPQGEERFFTERLLKMPHTRLCLTPPAKAPDVAPEPPMATLPWITFGCFQNASKINDSVIALWKRVLDAVPASVLRLQNGRFEEEQQVLRMRERLRNAGIDLRRVFISTNLPREHYSRSVRRGRRAARHLPVPRWHHDGRSDLDGRADVGAGHARHVGPPGRGHAGERRAGRLGCAQRRQLCGQGAGIGR